MCQNLVFAWITTLIRSRIKAVSFDQFSEIEQDRCQFGYLMNKFFLLEISSFESLVDDPHTVSMIFRSGEFPVHLKTWTCDWGIPCKCRRNQEWQEEVFACSSITSRSSNDEVLPTWRRDICTWWSSVQFRIPPATFARNSSITRPRFQMAWKLARSESHRGAVWIINEIFKLWHRSCLISDRDFFEAGRFYAWTDQSCDPGKSWTR